MKSHGELTQPEPNNGMLFYTPPLFWGGGVGGTDQIVSNTCWKIEALNKFSLLHGPK